MKTIIETTGGDMVVVANNETIIMMVDGRIIFSAWIEKVDSQLHLDPMLDPYREMEFVLTSYQDDAMSEYAGVAKDVIERWVYNIEEGLEKVDGDIHIHFLHRSTWIGDVFPEYGNTRYLFQGVEFKKGEPLQLI